MTELTAKTLGDLYTQLSEGGGSRLKRVEELRFEHESCGPVILDDEKELLALSNMFSSSAYGRALSFFNNVPPESWTAEVAGILERKLIPSGLVVVETTEHSQDVYVPSDVAKSGTYVAVIKDPKQES